MGNVKLLKKGEMIFKEGDLELCMYNIRSGCVGIYANYGKEDEKLLVELKAGEFKLIPLGVGMILPKGYEANIVPRSSTFKNWGLIQTNCFAVIDETYCGEEDMWRYPVYATRDTIINKGERICQFRINKHQPELFFNKVEHLKDKNRGGFGSTGK